MRSADRARSAVDQTSVGGAITGNVDDLFKITRPFFSSFAPQGRFFSAPGVTAGTFDRNGNFITGFFNQRHRNARAGWFQQVCVSDDRRSSRTIPDRDTRQL
ncbi:MAG: hypothetical protein IPO50_03295 [Sphingomonadales bacterium]|nr:hypothetical protein [Sphingomonadales bacterium]